MKKYISSYIAQTDEFIAHIDGKSADEITEYLTEMEKMMVYFANERLIHLIVTVLFALMEMGAVYAFFICQNLSLVLLCFMFLLLLVPYVMHYYFLENSVQHLYHLRDRIREAIKKNGR